MKQTEAKCCSNKFNQSKLCTNLPGAHGHVLFKTVQRWLESYDCLCMRKVANFVLSFMKYHESNFFIIFIDTIRAHDFLGSTIENL